MGLTNFDQIQGANCALKSEVRLHVERRGVQDCGEYGGNRRKKPHDESHQEHVLHVTSHEKSF